MVGRAAQRGAERAVNRRDFLKTAFLALAASCRSREGKTPFLAFGSPESHGVLPAPAAAVAAPQTPAEPAAIPEVYFSRRISPEGVMRVYEKIAPHVHGKVALKVHFGEEGNPNYLKPDLMRELALRTHATLVETNVLYVGKRRYTESHIRLARDHGFTYAPIDILDSEGDVELPVANPRIRHYKKVKVGSHMDRYGTFIVFSHFKGHGSAGFGGAIKNVAMGFASVAGKMAQHANDIPTVAPERCVKCMRCVRECPAHAITVDDAGVRIDRARCIGCAKCIGECPQRVFGVPRGLDKQIFHERLAEYAKVISDRYPMVYITVLANISRGCDCMKSPQKPFMDDVGVLASTDMLAIDAAAHNLVNQAAGREDVFRDQNSVSGKLQLLHGAEIGLGSLQYRLVEVD